MEDLRTLWVGNLDDKVNEDLLYELFLQTGPIDRLILPSDGDGENKKHKGHAYIVFKHTESVQYATQVMDGTSLYEHPLKLNARSLPITYRKATPQSNSNRGGGGGNRFDNSSLRGGFNKSSTWHGPHGNDLMPRGRGGNFRNRGGGFVNNFNQSNNTMAFHQQSNVTPWMGNQVNVGLSFNTPPSDTGGNLDDKRSRILQQQNISIETHRQMQQGVMNVANMNLFNNLQHQHHQQQQQQPIPSNQWPGVFPNPTPGGWNMQQQSYQGTWYQGQ